jgi:hypothetical protein
MALLDHLGRSRAGEVGQLHGLEVGLQALRRLSSGAFGGEALDPPARTAGERTATAGQIQ